jgi:DNA-binding response OmpR family regulator
MADGSSRAVVLVVATENEWTGRALESLLEGDGYAVRRVRGTEAALELARRTPPDAVLLEDQMNGTTSVELCRALRRVPGLSPATPFFVLATARPALARDRAAAFEAGAWEYCTTPFDTDILRLKLRAFLEGKRALDNCREYSLLDPVTGLYTFRGLVRLAAEFGARAARCHEALACLALAPATADDLSGDAIAPRDEAANRMMEACRTHLRRSDVLAFLGDSAVAALTPMTDAAGVIRLVARIRQAMGGLNRGNDAPGKASLFAGYCASPDFATAGMSAEEVATRASRALAHARQWRLVNRVVAFDELAEA